MTEATDKERKPHIVRRLYDWVMHWSDTPYGGWALALIAFAESSFFPVPPDPLLLALAISARRKAFYYALICSVCSVLGGMFGYFIGYALFNSIGEPILKFYGVMDKFDYVKELYNQNAFLGIAIAGFTPIPYKVFTIAAGVCKVSFTALVLASALSRSTRFFLEALAIYIFGPPIRATIEKYFDLACILFVILLVGGFVIIKLVL